MRGLIAGLAVSSVALAAAAATAQECTNETWNKIMERDKLVVGIKPDYKPWGFRNESGELVGMEADMAQAVADTLGVELELVPVQSSNRMQFLEQGKIDLMIATMSDTADRRQIVGTIQPNYYASGTNVLAPKALEISEWEDLRGKPVCGMQGAFYNKIVEDRYDVEIVAFTGNAEAKQALRDRKCVAWVYDDSSIQADLATGQFGEFEMPLPSEDETPWALAVPLGERECILGRFMSGMVFNWLQDGTLAEMEKKWGIQPSGFLKQQQERLADPLASGG